MTEEKSIEKAIENTIGEKPAGMIYELWPKVLKAVGPLAKDKKEGGSRKFEYHSIEAVTSAAQSALASVGVAIQVRQTGYEIINSSPPLVIVNMSIDFIAPDGSMLTTTSSASHAMRDDAAMSAAASGAFKFALKRMLVIGEADDDPDKLVNDIDTNTPTQNERREQPRQANQAPANGKPQGGKGGGYPLMDSLYKLSQALGMQNEEINTSVKKALKIADGGYIPKLKDVGEKGTTDEKFAIVKAFIINFVKSRMANDAATKWFSDNGYTNSAGFFAACYRGEVKTNDITTLIEAVNSNTYVEQDQEPPPPNDEDYTNAQPEDDIPF